MPVYPAESTRPIGTPTPPPAPVVISQGSSSSSVDPACSVSPNTMPTRSNGSAVCIHGRLLKFDSAVPGRTLVSDGKGWYDPNPPAPKTVYVYVKYPFDQFSSANFSGAPTFNDTPPTAIDIRTLSERLARRHDEVQQHLREQADKAGIVNDTNKEIDDLVLQFARKYKLPHDLLQFPDSLLGYDPKEIESQLTAIAKSVRKMDKLNDMLTALKREYKKTLVAVNVQQSSQEMNRLQAILRENEKLQGRLFSKAQATRKRHARLVEELKRLKDETPITKRQLDDLKSQFMAAKKGLKERQKHHKDIQREYAQLESEIKQFSGIARKAYGSAHHEIMFGLDESSALQEMSESSTRMLVNLDERTRVLRDRIIDLVPSARRDLLTASELEALAQKKAKNGSHPLLTVGGMKNRIDILEKALVAAKLENQEMVLKNTLTNDQLPVHMRAAPSISDREHPKLTVNATSTMAVPEYKHSLRTQLLNYVDEETPYPRQKALKKPLGKAYQVPLTKERK